MYIHINIYIHICVNKPVSYGSSCGSHHARARVCLCLCVCIYIQYKRSGEKTERRHNIFTHTYMYIFTHTYMYICILIYSIEMARAAPRL